MRSLEVVTDQYRARREQLLAHPAFDSMEDVYRSTMTNKDLATYIETWEAHTDRGRAWVAAQEESRRVAAGWREDS